MKNYFSKWALPVMAMGLMMASCEDVPAPYYIIEDPNAGEITDESGNKVLPYTETFETSMGDYANYLTSGAGAWVIDYSCAKATGYDNTTKVTTAGTYYLVSPSITLEGQEAAHVEYDYILRYNKGNENQQVMINANFDEANPGEGWVSLTSTHTEGSDWSTWASGNVNIPAEYMGKVVRIAFMYNTNATSGSTWEVKNVAVKPGAGNDGTGDNNPAVDPDAVQELPFGATFASDFGGFQNQTTDGSGAWVIDYSTATATGYDNASQTTTAGTYFLVSPQINLAGKTAAHVVYDYILRYNKGNENQQLMINANYDVEKPAEGWVTLNSNHTEGSDWNTFAQADINIPAEYMGKVVRVAFMYNTNAESGSTWEVKNFTIAEGEAGSAVDPGTDDKPASSTKENPWSVAQAIANQGSSEFVKGYIVGYVDGQSYSAATFAVPAAAETEVLIADAADVKDASMCLPIQLPVGAIREAVELFAHPQYLGKEVIFYGSLEKYFGTSGMKSTSFVMIDGTTAGTDPSGENPGENPGGDTPAAGTIFSAALTDGDGGFTTNDVVLPEGITYVWTNNSTYGWKASAYVSDTNYATESWCISPAITLDANSNAVLTFDHARKFGDNSQLSVNVSTDKSNWTPLTVATWPDGSSWSYVSSGNIDLSAYNGQTIYIGFKYTSTTSSAATWEFKNFVITGNGGSVNPGEGGNTGGGENPGGGETPDTPTTGSIGTLVGNVMTVATADFGLENASDLTSYTLSDGTVISFSQNDGTNSPKYYTSGAAARMYAKNSVSFKSTSKKITGVELTCVTKYLGNEQLTITADGTAATVTKNDPTITATGMNGNEVIINNDYTSTSAGTQLRIVSFKITYAE